MTTTFDQRSFRSALGRFATGVTIITARGTDGPVGVTANSFNSVSLDPPLVLWSLARTSSSLAGFDSADEFAIHVLGLDQEHLSGRFATSGADKFKGMDIATEGAPLLDGCAARFRCRKVQQHDVGDHILFIGEVIEFDTRDGAPLLYLHGSYGEARRREQPELAYDFQAAPLGNGSIVNLISDAYGRILERVHARFDALDLRQPAAVVLIALAAGNTDLGEIERIVAERNFRFSAEDQDAMIQRGLIAIEGREVRLLPAGGQIHGRILDALKEVEDGLVAPYTAGEVAEARHFLAKIGLTED